ncbi:hypothetical protein D9619_012103 [Psilocybe cf. subviscida]|uniref:Uncharacterized protein n=1 Tax=Psilocybe cf. subviscida TaxID=2480587 RepID=A0A8H5B9D3_9AGAR|nr:hypothetical protein D9619_012103 [Psilocybe cf. subviscida]
MAGQSDQLDISLLESYKRRRIAIANMPEIPPSPPPPHFDHLTPSEFDEARTHRIGHLRGRVGKAFTAARGNPADGRWGALSDLLSLSCTAGREGRWTGLRLDPAPGEEEEDDDEVLDQLGVVLARTEEEWFAWEARYEKRMNVRRRVGAWSKGVELPAAAESPTAPSSRSRPRRKSPLHVVVSADEPKEEEEEEEVVEIVHPVAAKAKTRVARMSTGGKSPRKPKAQQEEQIASTSGTGKVVNIVSATVPDALRNSAPFGFGVVKRPTAKGKEKEKATDAAPKKKVEELKRKKQQERVEWEKGRERKLREAREKEAEKARRDKEKEEAERRSRQEEEEAEKRRREEEAEEVAVVVDKGQRHRMQIQDVSEMSFIPPSFPSSAVMHSTPKPPPVRPTKPFGRRNTSPLIPRLEETRRNDKVVEVPLPAAEESSYSLGVSMVTSADLPSQILIPPPTTTKRKRSRPVSPTPEPVIRSERPEKKARYDGGSTAREPLQEPNEDVSEISFLPPSFPPGGIVTSTPKPPSKSTSPEKAKAKATTASPNQRETTPTPSSTRPFLLPPTPKTNALEASASLPAIPPHPHPSPLLPASPTNTRQANKRPASPSPPPARSAHALLKKAKTMPAAALVSPPSSPTRRLSSPAKAPDSWLRSPGARRVRNVPSAEDAIVARTTLLNVRHVLADQQAATVLPLLGMGAAQLPVTPQKRRHALPTLTDLLASSTRARKGKGSASAKKLRKTLIVRTPSGERVDLMAVGALKPGGKTQGPGKMNGSQGDGPGNAGGEQQEENEREESVRDNAEPSTMGTGLENYQQLKAAANASTDIFLVDSSPPPPYFGSNADNNALALPESQPAMDSPPPPQSAEPPTDPYSDAYHFTEDIVVPTGSKLRTFPGAGGSYPFASGGVDPYADNPYDDPYASAGEHVGISPTKSLSSLAGSDSDSSGDDAADGSESDDSPLRRRTGGGGFGFGAGVLSPGFVFDPRAASTQVPPGLNFGVGTGGGGSSSLFSAATSGARSVPPAVEAAKQPAASQESKDSWASMYVSSAPAERASSGNSAKDPSPQYALPEALQPAPSSSSPMHAERNSSTPVHAPPPPSSSNPRFSFSSQAFGGNFAKHVDMVSRLLDKDVDFGGWLKDPEEVDEPQRGVEESP